MRIVLGVIRGIIAVFVVAVLAIPIVCAATGTKPYIVAGGSMEPTYHLGDVVYVHQSTTYAVGDVVQILKGDAYVHRIVAACENGKFAVPEQPEEAWPTCVAGTFLTLGDANEAPDLDPVGIGDIGGKVVVHVADPWARVIRIGSTWPGRIFGSIVCILVLWPWGEGRRKKRRE
jgi:signal peptidase I